MHKGTIKWFNIEKGFGFIRADDATLGDVFVGIRTLEASPLDSLSAGQKVAFDVERDPRGRGLRATALALPPK